jgi:Tfp pilus assembly protein PilV
MSKGIELISTASFPKFSAAKRADNQALPNYDRLDSVGFSLVEALMAILVLAVGFMFVAPMIYHSIKPTTLARSKDTAILAAANQLETLGLKYKANINDPDLTPGDHGPVQVVINNPNDSGSITNQYNVGWSVSSVPDSRGKTLRAVQITATATPIRGTGSGTTNIRVDLNKVVSMTTIFSY